MSDAATSSSFPETHWSVVIQLRSTAEPARQRALEALCEQYWQPLYALARFAGRSPHDAEDLAQGFLTRLLGRGELGAPTPDQGRFRTFLQAAFRNYMIDEARRENRQKRGGGERAIPLDFAAGEHRFQQALADGATPAAAYDRLWASTLLQHAVTALRKKYEQRGRLPTFTALAVFLEGDSLAPSYAELGARLGQTENTIAAQVSRLRREFRETLRREVAATLADPSETEEEMRYLLRAAE